MEMPKNTCKVIVAASFLMASSMGLAQDEDPPPKKQTNSRDFTVGKPTQKVTPRELKETTRPDGARSIVTGQTRDSSGKIDPNRHSHSVVRDGKVVSSRTAGMERGTTLPEAGARTFPPDVRGTDRASGISTGGGGSGAKKQTKQTD